MWNFFSPQNDTKIFVFSPGRSQARALKACSRKSCSRRAMRPCSLFPCRHSRSQDVAATSFAAKNISAGARGLVRAVGIQETAIRNKNLVLQESSKICFSASGGLAQQSSRLRCEREATACSYFQGVASNRHGNTPQRRGFHFREKHSLNRRQRRTAVCHPSCCETFRKKNLFPASEPFSLPGEG